MRRATLPLITIALAGCVLVGCTGGAATATGDTVAFFFPRHSGPLGSGDMARLEGEERGP
jgi:hypothetical protein